VWFDLLQELKMIGTNFPEPFLALGGDTEYEKKNIETVRRVMEEFWVKGNTAIASELFTADGVRHDPSVPDTVGPQAYSGMVQKYHKSFEFEAFDLQLVLTAGNWMAWRTETRGTHTGPFQGIPATGAKITVLSHTFVRFNEDSMADEAWVLTDYYGMLLDLMGAMTFWQKLWHLPSMLLNDSFGRDRTTEVGGKSKFGWLGGLFGIRR